MSILNLKRSAAVACLLFSGLMAQMSHAALNAVNSLKVSALPNNQVLLTLTFQHALAHPPKSFITKVPPRLVFDFQQTNNRVSNGDSDRLIDLGALHKVNLVQSGQRTRLMLNLKEVVRYSSKVAGNRVSITLSGGKAALKDFSYKRFPVKDHYNHLIKRIDFRSAKEHTGKIIVKFSDAHVTADIQRKRGKLIVTFVNTFLPERYRYRLDVRDFDTPADLITTRRVGRNTRIEIKTSHPYEHFAYQINKQFIIEVQPTKQIPTEATAGIDDRIYKGKRINLNFHNIKVRSLLQLLAETSGFNIVVSDTVQGNMTIRLKNVPWDQALDIILKTRGLGKRVFGSVMLIAPAQEIAAQEKHELEAKLEVQRLAPLISELIQVNYSKAADLAALLKDKGNTLLSERGNVSVDERTNTLWVQDTSDTLKEVRTLVHKLDKPVKQVLIETRIVLINKDYEQALGVQFGVTHPRHLSGTLEGANDLASGTPVTQVPVLDRLNVNLPAMMTMLDGTPTSIALALAKLSNGYLLDLELSALENEGHAEIVSTPRIITANQQPAQIQQGEEIPYEEATSSGATSIAFKKAVLSLQVTPQITPDNKILLELQVNKDSRSTNKDIKGVPAIDTKELQTNVLVNNGQTIVLGGIYEQIVAHNVQRVPLLGRLPVLGALFRKRNDIDKQDELLIFVTPKIVEQNFIG